MRSTTSLSNHFALNTQMKRGNYLDANRRTPVTKYTITKLLRGGSTYAKALPKRQTKLRQKRRTRQSDRL